MYCLNFAGVPANGPKRQYLHSRAGTVAGQLHASFTAEPAGALRRSLPGLRFGNLRRIGKDMFYKQLERGVSQAYEYAADVMAGNMMAEDTGEGIDAFIEKRKPVWKNES